MPRTFFSSSPPRFLSCFATRGERWHGASDRSLRPEPLREMSRAENNFIQPTAQRDYCSSRKFDSKLTLPHSAELDEPMENGEKRSNFEIGPASSMEFVGFDVGHEFRLGYILHPGRIL